MKIVTRKFCLQQQLATGARAHPPPLNRNPPKTSDSQQSRPLGQRLLLPPRTAIAIPHKTMTRRYMDASRQSRQDTLHRPFFLPLAGSANHCCRSRSRGTHVMKSTNVTNTMVPDYMTSPYGPYQTTGRLLKPLSDQGWDVFWPGNPRVFAGRFPVPWYGIFCPVPRYFHRT